MTRRNRKRLLDAANLVLVVTWFAGSFVVAVGVRVLEKIGARDDR